MQNWGPFLADEILSLYSGVGVSSVGEALSLSRAYFMSRQAKRVFFRGQQDIGWPLLSTMGRHFHENDQGIANPSEVTDSELDALRRFQRDWKRKLVRGHSDDVDRSRVLAEDSAGWWILMQHYRRPEDRTRLLDITSSVLAGLYFTCEKSERPEVNSCDGALYLFSEENLAARLHQAGPTSDWEDHESEKVDALFRVDHVSTPRILLTRHTNERLKAQMGAFLWWPKFNNPLVSSYAFLRVRASSKQAIMKELGSYGVDEEFIYRRRDPLLANTDEEGGPATS